MFGNGRVVVALVLACSCAAAVEQELQLVVNPYDGVDWAKVEQHKANLHAHTVASGGKLFLDQLLRGYTERGYSILAVTDHDRITRWDLASGDPMKAYGVLPVLAQEHSRGEHVNAYFSGFQTRSDDLAAVVKGVAGAGGLSVINHPGRYWRLDAEGRVPRETVANYVRLLSGTPTVLGIEVFNKGTRNPHDVPLWDALLETCMPGRAVWGFANDDTHESKQIGHCWQVFLLDALVEQDLRHAMLNGQFYFCSRARGHTVADIANEPPVICSIRHDVTAKTITIVAAADGERLDAEHFRWVADGRTLCAGATLDYGRTSGLQGYARAEVSGLGGTTYTNPFGFSRTAKQAARAPEPPDRRPAGL